MAAGAAGAAAAAAASGAAVAAASGATGINPPSIAGHDMMWKHVMSGGQWHWASWWQLAFFFFGLEFRLSGGQMMTLWQCRVLRNLKLRNNII